MRTLRPLVLLALVALAGCGAGRAQPSPATITPEAAPAAAGRAALRARLLDTLTPARPFWGFLAPGRPRLAPLAEAAVALDAAGTPAPRAATRALQRFWAPAAGLYRDPGTPVPALATTWLALRALATGGAAGREDVRAHAAPILEAIAARAGSGGLAWEPGRRADPVATLYGARVLDVLRGAGADPDAGEALRALAAATGCPPGVAGTAASARLEARVLAGLRCPANARRRIRAAALAARPPGSGPAALERARALLVLRDAGLLPAATAREAARRTLSRGAAATAGGPTLARVRADLARAAGLAVRIPGRARAALRRAVRWQGRLPDLLAQPDPLETVMGARALAALGPRASRPGQHWVDWGAPGLAGADRAVLALGLAPERLRAADARDALARARRSRALRDIAVAALASAAAPGGCHAGGPALRRLLAPVLASRRLAQAPPTGAYWVALAGTGARRCAPAAGRTLLAAVRVPLAAARRPGGLYAPRGARPDLLSTWAGLQAACLAGVARPADPRAAGRLARTGETGADAAAAFAAGRLPALAAGRCAGDWWQPALRSSAG